MSSLQIIDRPSAKFDHRPPGQTPSVIIIHFSATLTTEEIFDIFIRGPLSLSSHYVVDDQGRVFRLVEEKHRAWHAGQSAIDDVANVNDYSIGIELRNAGKLTPIPGNDEFLTVQNQRFRPPPVPVRVGSDWWEGFARAQIDSLVALCRRISLRYNIPPQRVLGHSDVALPPGRKIDPGPLFDWKGFRGALAGER